MKVIKVTKEYFETECEKVYFFEPLEKEISVEDMQKIVDAYAIIPLGAMRYLCRGAN